MMMIPIIIVNITGDAEAQCPPVTMTHFTVGLGITPTSPRAQPARHLFQDLVHTPSVRKDERLLRSWPHGRALHPFQGRTVHWIHRPHCKC